MNTSGFLASLEQLGLSILAGAAQSTQPLNTIDATHPLVSAAVDAGQIGAQLASVSGVPVAQIATLGLSLAQTFAQMFASKPAPATAPAG